MSRYSAATSAPNLILARASETYCLDWAKEGERSASESSSGPSHSQEMTCTEMVETAFIRTVVFRSAKAPPRTHCEMFARNRCHITAPPKPRTCPIIQPGATPGKPRYLQGCGLISPTGVSLQDSAKKPRALLVPQPAPRAPRSTLIAVWCPCALRAPPTRPPLCSMLPPPSLPVTHSSTLHLCRWEDRKLTFR